jgi:hypothetical protein
MEKMATEKQIKYMYALEKKLGRQPKWREGVTFAYAQSLIEELLGELKGLQP